MLVKGPAPDSGRVPTCPCGCQRAKSADGMVTPRICRWPHRGKRPMACPRAPPHATRRSKSTDSRLSGYAASRRWRQAVYAVSFWQLRQRGRRRQGSRLPRGAGLAGVSQRPSRRAAGGRSVRIGRLSTRRRRESARLRSDLNCVVDVVLAQGGCRDYGMAAVAADAGPGLRVCRQSQAQAAAAAQARAGTCQTPVVAKAGWRSNPTLPPAGGLPQARRASPSKGRTCRRPPANPAGTGRRVRSGLSPLPPAPLPSVMRCARQVQRVHGYRSRPHGA